MNETAEKLRVLIEHSPNVFYSRTAEHDLTYVSPQIKELLGVDPEEGLPKWTDFLTDDPVNLEGMRLSKEAIDSGKSPPTYELELVWQGGRKCRVEVTESPVIGDGKTVAIVGSFRDISQQKQRWNALLRREERYRELVDRSPDGIFVIAEGRFVFANCAIAKTLGLDRPEELIGEQLLDFVSPTYHEIVRELVDVSWDTGESANRIKVEFVRRDGTLVDVEATGAPLVCSQHTAWQVAVRDIRERKKEDDALIQSRKMVGDILRASPIGISYIEEGRLRWANQAMFEIFRAHREDEWREQSIDKFYASDEEYQRVQALFFTTLERGLPAATEALLRRRDGSVFHGHVRSVALDPAHPDRGSITTISDISDRKRAEDALLKSEEEYRSLFEDSLDGIYITALEGTLIDANEAFLRLVGYARNELMGQSITEIYADPTERKRFVHDIEQAGFVRDYPIRVRKKDTTEIDCVISATVRWAEDGSIAGYRGIIRDVTEQKRAAELLVQAERLRAVVDLAGGVAHNFNNLLHIVIGGLELALIELETENWSEVKHTLEQTLESSKFGIETVRRLQSFAQLRTGVLASEAEVFDLSEIAQQCAEMTRPWWKTAPNKEGVKIELHLDANDKCFVTGKKSELVEVLVNLVKNAVEALPRGGEIRIETSVQDRQVMLQVIDNGLGIKRDDLKRVFEPFWTTKGITMGTGMGLSVSHGIVNRYGGTISVESEEGTGTRFTIMLPLAERPSEVSVELSKEVFPLRLSFLVIDDVAPIVVFLEEILTQHEQKVFSAKSGEEGIEIFKNNKIDIVVCDLSMPGMSGWEVGKEIRRICEEQGIRKPPFILLTGWGGQTLGYEKTIQSGVDAVAEKPLDILNFLETIRKVLSSQAMPEEDK